MATQTSSTAPYHTKNKNQTLSPIIFSPYYWLNSYSLPSHVLDIFSNILGIFLFFNFIFDFPSSYDVHPPNNWMAHTPTSCKFLQFHYFILFIMSLLLDMVYCFVLMVLFTVVSSVHSRCSVFKWMNKWVLMHTLGLVTTSYLLTLEKKNNYRPTKS